MIQGCSDWLNVKPSDRVSEENAFSTISGFKQALNGIYVELNQSDLYGRALTAEFVEILAQRYAINEEATANLLLSKYEYGGSDAKSRASAIWAKAYNLIANTNLLVKNCDVNRSVLPDDYYHIVKGEALALRAMLHFDLFRLFGPVYGKDSTVTSIPYYKEFVLDVKPSLLGNEFIQQVIDDLSEAEENLQEYDPVITFGPKGDRLDNFKSDRNLRLNYYAVQALLSRVYLYRGNNAKALEYAKKVIEVQEQWFPWVKPLDIVAGSENPDRALFSYSERFDGVAVYFGWYTYGAYGYFKEKNMAFADGAIGWHIYSFSASQMRNPVFWSPTFVRLGAGATVGNVHEPFLSMTHHADLFIEALLDGKTAGEAAYASIPVLSWQNVFFWRSDVSPVFGFSGGAGGELGKREI